MSGENTGTIGRAGRGGKYKSKSNSNKLLKKHDD